MGRFYKRSKPLLVDKLEKQFKHFTNRSESSVSNCKQKPIAEKEKNKFVPSNPM